jgi:hypothetical protein
MMPGWPPAPETHREFSQRLPLLIEPRGRLNEIRQIRASSGSARPGFGPRQDGIAEGCDQSAPGWRNLSDAFPIRDCGTSSRSERRRLPVRQLPKQLIAIPMREARDGYTLFAKLKAGGSNQVRQ